jgi:two-component system, cell cycle response regulator
MSSTVRPSWASLRPTVSGRELFGEDRAGAWSTAGQRRRSIAYGSAALAVLALWLVFKSADAGHGSHDIAATAFFVPAALVAMLAALGAAARCAPEHGSGTAWRLLAYAFACLLAGSVLQMIYESRERVPVPAVSDVCYVAFFALLLVGLLRFPTGRRSGVARLRFGIDMAIVGLCGALAVTCVLPSRLAELGPHDLVDVVLLVYPIGDVLLLGAIGAILVRRTNIASAVPLRLLAAGVTCFVASRLVLAHPVLTFERGHAADAIWLVGLTLFAIAAATEPGADAHAAVSDLERPAAGWAPYLAMLVAFGLLVADHGSLAVVILAVAIAVMVCARQFFTSSDVTVAWLGDDVSTLDPLTGLPGRRELVIDLRRTLETASPTAQRTLALFDLDGFQLYNDTFGRPAGDQLLARLAERLQRALPAAGQAYRLDGDEFAVLVARGGMCTADIAQLGAEALSERGPGFAVAAAAGAATLPAEATDVASALHAAERRLYADRHGRSATALTSQMRDVLLAAIAEQTESNEEPAAELTEHMLDVGVIARDVARQMGLDAEQVELTMRTGELHDVGKIAIPESILYKPGPLNDDEWRFVRKHTLIGERVLAAAPAFVPVAKLVRSTHERYDGGGYPDGLAGEQIPLPARITFACDAYHATVANRPYARGVDADEVRAELRRNAGTQFDPQVIDALIAVLDARARATVEP